MTPRLTKNLLPAFLFAAVSLSLSLPLAARESSPRRAARLTPQETSEQQPESRPIRRPRGVKRIGRSILEALFLSCQAANVRKRRELSTYGPQFPDRYDESDFSFNALVGTNWPMVVDYELEQQGTTVITIEVKDAAPFTRTLTGGGIGERRTERFTLPVYKEKGPQPARISFKATRDGSNGKERAEFRLVEIGAGENAFAAAPKEPSRLEVAALGPLPFGVARPTRAPAGWQTGQDHSLYDVMLGGGPGNYVCSFKVKDIFGKWGAYIVTDESIASRTEPKQVREVALEERLIGPRWNPITRRWDGNDDNRRRVRPGVYWLSVAVWRSAEDGGDWDDTLRSGTHRIN